MNHRAAAEFWAHYDRLPESIKRLADRNFALLLGDSHHPSLHFKRAGPYWSARIGLRFRALGEPLPDGVRWFWIGAHDEYARILRAS